MINNEYFGSHIGEQARSTFGELITITTLEGINNILNQTVSFQENTWSTISIFEPTIKEVVEAIKSSKYKQQVEDLRTNLNSGNIAYYNDNKKRLPAVTFSATFDSYRTRENVKNYNNLIVIDIDKLDINEIGKCSDVLLRDEFVFSFWRSPSNNGFKGLVQLEFINTSNDVELDVMHKSAFKKLSDYFQSKYGLELDKSGSDITRLCFLSFDTELVIKENCSKFQVYSDDISVFVPKSASGRTSQIRLISHKDALFNPFERNKQYDRVHMSEIIRFLTKKNRSITYSYSEWCKVAMAIANTFTFDIGLKYFIKLSRLDGAKFNEVYCGNFLMNCYETRNGSVSFASIIHMANEKGYKTRQQKLKIKEEVPKVEF